MVMNNNDPDVRAVDSVEDVQSSVDVREIPIQRVGIRDIQYPVLVETAAGERQSSIAECSMYVNLPADRKGTHMSRFIELLSEGDLVISHSGVESLMFRMRERLESEHSYIKLRFPYFARKKAPVTGAESLMDYQVSLTARLIARNPEIMLRVVVPVTSLCPCSKKISRYGAHNQRSHVTVEVIAGQPFWIDDVVRLVEAEASCELYSLLKRADEQFITEKAYDNPKFVEDMIRDVATRLEQEPCVSCYRVECENFESIHNHSAYAMIEKNWESI